MRLAPTTREKDRQRDSEPEFTMGEGFSSNRRIRHASPLPALVVFEADIGRGGGSQTLIHVTRT